MIKKLAKAKKGAWFVPVRGSYLPNNQLGWLTYLPFVAYLVFVSVFAWQNAGTKTQAVLFILPNWVAATVVMTWIAKHTS